MKVITRSRQRRLTRSVKVSRDKRFPLLLQELAGDESRGSAHHVTRLRWITHTHTQDVEAQCLERTTTWRGSRADLPPVGIFSVDDLEDVAPLENHPGLPARDQVVAGGVVVKVRPHVHLRERARERRNSQHWETVGAPPAGSGGGGGGPAGAARKQIDGGDSFSSSKET